MPTTVCPVPLILETTGFRSDMVVILPLIIKKDKWDISVGGNYTRNDLNGYREGNVWTENVENNTINYFPSKGERSFNRYNYAGTCQYSVYGR